LVKRVTTAAADRHQMLIKVHMRSASVQSVSVFLLNQLLYCWRVKFLLTRYVCWVISGAFCWLCKFLLTQR